MIFELPIKCLWLIPNDGIQYEKKLFLSSVQIIYFRAYSLGAFHDLTFWDWGSGFGPQFLCILLFSFICLIFHCELDMQCIPNSCIKYPWYKEHPQCSQSLMSLVLSFSCQRVVASFSMSYSKCLKVLPSCNMKKEPIKLSTSPGINMWVVSMS